MIPRNLRLFYLIKTRFSVNLNDDLFNRQRKFFMEGNTCDIRRRVDSLRSRGNELARFGKQMDEAVYMDLRKSAIEFFDTETSSVQHEIKCLSSKLASRTRPHFPRIMFWRMSLLPKNWSDNWPPGFYRCSVLILRDLDGSFLSICPVFNHQEKYTQKTTLTVS
jgi:hypothetical protein